jgi:hypothetical protein
VGFCSPFSDFCQQWFHNCAQLSLAGDRDSGFPEISPDSERDCFVLDFASPLAPSKCVFPHSGTYLCHNWQIGDPWMNKFQWN